jgi:type IV pilus assembly protein PilA
MKPELQAKFLQHLNKKKTDGGFTLIELLVVIIIIGILAAIALPSLLAQSNKARQSEARNNTGVLNRAQQAFFLEKQGFTSSLADLGIGIAQQSANYKYEIFLGGTTASDFVAANVSTPVSTGILKAYAGIVYVTTIQAQGSAAQSATQAKTCEGKDGATAAITVAPPSTQAGSASVTGSSPTCAGLPDYVDLGAK